MVDNPTYADFTSVDHGATQPNGQPKITHYDLSVFAADDPSGAPGVTVSVAKDDPRITQLGPNDYRVNIEGLYPADAHGWQFIRGTRAGENGPYGTGVEFQLGVAPIAAVNVTAMGSV